MKKTEAVNHVGPCPSCGYCPTCGRKNAAPVYPYPYYPYWSYPWWYTNTTIAPQQPQSTYTVTYQTTAGTQSTLPIGGSGSATLSY